MLNDGDDFATFYEPGRRIPVLAAPSVTTTIPDKLAQSFAADIVSTMAARLAQETGTADKASRASPEIVDRFCAALLDSDGQRATQLVEDLLQDGATAELIYESYVTSAARELGDRWVADTTSFFDVSVGVGRLHAIVRDLGNAFFLREPSAREELTALFAATPGETHVLGITMAADYFRRAGWAVDLRTHASLDDLIAAARTTQPALVGVTIGSRRQLPVVSKTIDHLRAVAPTAKVCIGGYLVASDPNLVEKAGADYLVADAATAAISLRARVATEGKSFA